MFVGVVVCAKTKPSGASASTKRAVKIILFNFGINCFRVYRPVAEPLALCTKYQNRAIHTPKITIIGKLAVKNVTITFMIESTKLFTNPLKAAVTSEVVAT